MFTANDHQLPSNTRLEKELPPSNTRWAETAQPSITRKEEEIERLLVEVAHLREQNAKLVERLAVCVQVQDLEAFRERVLKSPTLRKASAGV